MISQTADAGRTPTQRNTPPLETCLRVIVLSFIALTLSATPREGAAPPLPPLDTRVIVGSGVGGQSKVRAFDGDTAAPLPPPLGSFTALTQNPGGEVRVAGCDFNADGTDDIIASPGLGKRAEVRIFDGVTGLPFPVPLGSFLAFENGFLGGVHVACGDLTGDTIPDIIAARGALAKPEVRVFNGVTAAPLPPPLGSFFAFEQKFLGGVRVAACDLNQDSKTEIVAARGPLGRPEVRTFDGATGNVFPPPLSSFLAFNQNFLGGVYVACGDLSGDTIPDIIATRGGLAKPEVRVFNGVTAAPLPPPFGSFRAFEQTFLGGVRVASCDLNQDGRTDIIAGRGPGAKPEVRAFDGVSGTPFPPPLGSFLAFGATFKGGVYLACSPNDSGSGPPPADTAPAVASTIPSNGATGVTTNSNLTIAFNEPVNVTGNWFQVNCPISGVRNVADTVVSGGPTTFTIDPVTDFAPGEACTTTVFAAQIADVDSNDPPDNMAADFTFGFTTDAAPTVSSTVPSNGATGVAVDSNITVTFSEPVAITASTFGLECPAGTPVPFAVSPAPPGNTGSFTLNPNADLPGGTCTVRVTAATVTDVDTNDPPDAVVADFTSTFTSGANNPPSFTKGPNQTVDEDAGPQTVSPWATAIDDGDPAVTQALTFSITGNTNPSLFSAGPSVSPTGVLTYTPAANASGIASITLALSDDGGTPGTPGDDATSAPQTFTITVNAANDAPTFSAGPNQAVDEDSGAQTGSGWATAIDDGDPESTQTVSFDITGNTDSSLFSSGPSVSPSGVLTYTPAVNAFGSATITLSLSDDGGTANGGVDTSAGQTFTITINAVNDAPSFTAGPNQSVLEDAGPQTVSPWATAISPGPANESGQTVSFNITSNTNPGLFSAGPTVTPAGVLTYTPAPNAFGGATIMLVAQDSGGVVNGGVDTSGPQGFMMTVTALNDPPQVTPPPAYPAHAHIAINIPDGATDLFDGSTITDVDGPGAAPFSITPNGPFASLNGGTVTIAANGSFSYNPPVGFTGANDSFTYTICDSGVPLPGACTNATATVTVSGPRVWFVNNSLGSSGDGRLSSPFNTLGAADTAASASGDRIFVFTGAGSYVGGFGLLTNQRLIGQGVVDTDFDTALGITPPAPSVARPAINGTRPTINGTITLATGGTARGFNVNNTTVTGVSGSGATSLIVNQVSVTTTTGTAVNLLNSGGTVSFTSVSANGGTNGIVLNNTTGSFTVTGTGAAGTGGTIQNTTTRGASFISASNITLNNMNFTNAATVDFPAAPTGLSLGNNTADNAAIHLETVFTATLNGIVINGSAEQGINGHNVKDFTLQNSGVQNSSITNAGNAADEDGIHFYNMLGTSSITNNTTISSSGDDNINVQNNTNAALPAGMTPVLNLAITNGSANTGVLGSGYLMGIRGTSAATVTIDGVTANNNFSGGVVIDTFDTATSTIEVKNSTITNNNDGISLSSNNGSTKFDIHDNTSFAGNDFARISILKAAFSTTGTLQGKIRNNPIAVSDGQTADGIIVNQAGDGTLTASITGNTIAYRGTQRAMLIQGGQDGSGQLNATVTGNNIDMQIDGTNNPTTGILAQTAVASPSGDNTNMCADIGGVGALINTFTHSIAAANMAAGDIRVRQRFVTTVTLPGYGGANSDNAAVVTYLTGRNTLVNSPTATATNDVGVVVGAGGFVGGACTQPVFP